MERGPDQRGAHTVTVGEGRQSRHVATQGICNGFGLGVAQFRELARCIDDRTVVLAHLVLTGHESARLRSEARRVESIDDTRDRLTFASDHRPCASTSEFGYGLAPLGLGQELQGGESQIVVGLVAGRASALRERVDPARTSATTPGARTVGGLSG